MFTKNSEYIITEFTSKWHDIVVNLMPDERTNSFITWLNSPNRRNQRTQTGIDLRKM